MLPSVLRIATRRSPLALIQTEQAEAALRLAQPGLELERILISTTGDHQQNWSLEQQGGTGLFTKELEEALLDGRADLAVHSAKDLPMRQREGLSILGYLPRANPQDVLVCRDDVETPGRIATSSPRRRAQLSQRYPDAEWTTIRGRVETRLRKIAEGEADATVLAAAGLERLGISSHPGLRITRLTMPEMVPAPAQAAIALQVSSGRRSDLEGVGHAPTLEAVEIEQAFLLSFGDVACQVAHGSCFADGSLYVFHEQFGFREFDLSEHPEGSDRIAEARRLGQEMREAEEAP